MEQVKKRLTALAKQDQSYINSVDGLRALSVLLVVLFHANASLLGGGYIGVDAFFVISGFVITTNIVKSIEARTFSYANFLLRRYARLTPALLVVIATTFIAGLYLLTPRQLIEFSKESISALLSVSNIFFFFNSGYFDGNAAWKPLLHTWSLGVEEQFYLVWPLLLILVYRTKNRLIAASLIAGLSLLSYIATIWLADRSTNAVFYLMPFRVYQLGLGALIAISRLSITGAKGTGATIIGVAALVAASVCFSGTTSVAISGISSAIAAALFILGAGSSLATLAFGNRIVSSIGRQAYSIYLVHWPLIVLSRDYVSGANPIVSMSLVVVASFALGAVLHRLIENPLRMIANQPRERSPLRRLVFAGSLSLQACLILASSVLVANNGFALGRYPILTKIVDRTLTERGQIAAISEFGKCTIADGYDHFDPDGCLSFASDRPTVALLGDSSGIDTIVALRDEFGPRYHFAHASYAGCPPLLPSPKNAQLLNFPHCVEFNRQRFDIIEKMNFKTVVLTAGWEDDFIESSAETVQFLASRGIKVYVVGVRAIFDQDVTDLLIKAGSVEDANRSLRSHLLSGLVEMNAHFANLVHDAGGEYIEVLSWQCDKVCPATDQDGDLLYVDEFHFSHAGMTLLAGIISNSIHGQF
jgi:peptidoglycan/LPS O-acetylase OafA/YrhL